MHHKYKVKVLIEIQKFKIKLYVEVGRDIKINRLLNLY